MSGSKVHDLMPTNCSVLRTPTIRPDIRISWDYHPTICEYRGGLQGLSPTYEQAHVGLDLLTMVLKNKPGRC